MALAREAYQYRQVQVGRDPTNWGNGKKNVAIVVTNSGHAPYGSGADHSEELIIANWTALGYPSPTNRIISIFTERSPCGPTSHDCDAQLRQWLQPQIGANIYVHYLVPYQQGQPGSEILAAYAALGIS